ncbi:unnamed protein product (macronuclear) [Paramecium tetraurelia]|uniref:Uncharacterized protein n=1 Tax=Paramecium tetraurelia TaxID=5888 RepID=A0CPN9_PARTE|nr:uncharacterized protein GSPATT00009148001 [Paramecium tetraurelia]CAK72756.1 unnamed protein product [Paramecium tetraurelia]|eukprot:XP_001440153.1 hypothetical protein (macronuclear) [Paramecium tetraurelia strain d4-2]
MKYLKFYRNKQMKGKKRKKIKNSRDQIRQKKTCKQCNLLLFGQTDGLAKHPQQFQPGKGICQFFQKSDFLLPKQPKSGLERIQSAWLPTYTHSRLMSATPLDTEPFPRPPSVKEKVWRPFSSQPNKLNMIQLVPHSPKDDALTPKKNSLAFDIGEKLVPMKPFQPTRRIFSAFPK